MPVNAVVEQVWLARGTGYSALVALLASQSLRPLRRWGIVSPQTHLRWRRRLGILAAFLASGHALLQWFTFLQGDLRQAARETLWLQFGMVAWALLLVLWLTSYPRVVRWLRLRHWQELHRLSYVATLWACLHVLLAPWGTPWLALLFLLFSVVLLLLRIPHWRRILKR